MMLLVFVFQAEDGIRDLVRSRWLGDVYKRQVRSSNVCFGDDAIDAARRTGRSRLFVCRQVRIRTCLLYTSDAADERSSVDLGGRRIIKKKKR